MEVHKTKNEFGDYIEKLSFDEKCRYMEELLGIVNLCSYPLFKCEFRKKEVYKNRGTEKHECRRQDIARIRRILG